LVQKGSFGLQEISSFGAMELSVESFELLISSDFSLGVQHAYDAVFVRRNMDGVIFEPDLVELMLVFYLLLELL